MPGECQTSQKEEEERNREWLVWKEEVLERRKTNNLHTFTQRKGKKGK